MTTRRGRRAWQERRGTMDRFAEALATLPRPGGNGYHPRLLGVANIGMRAGLAPGEVAAALREHTPHGTRHVPDREIRDAVEKAASERTRPPRHWGGARWRTVPTTARAASAAPAVDAARFMERMLAKGAGVAEVDLWEASPVRLDTPPGPEDAVRLLEALYAPGDILFLGDRYGRAVKTAAGWIADFRAGKPVPPHAMPNPVSGIPARTKDGRPSYRADACVQSFRYAVAEFDGLGRDEQLAFWWAVDLPVAALIDSGGKSLHAWIRVDGVGTAAQWTDTVEELLFARWLVPLGCDAACRNEARLSRLPGCFRAEKGRWQRLLYLAPEGRAVHAGA